MSGPLSFCAIWMVLAAAGASSAEEKPPTTLMVHIVPTRDDRAMSAIMEKIAEISEPEVVDVPQGKALQEIVKERCGNTSKELLSIVRRLNPGINIGVAGAASTARVPVCPYWALNKAIRVDEGGAEGAGEAMEALMGHSGPRTQSNVLRANPKLRGSLENLEAGDVMTLPWAARPTGVPLKPEFAAHASIIAAELRALVAQLAVRPPEVTETIDLVRDVTPANDNDAECAGLAEAGASWPFPRDIVLDVLSKTGQESRVRVLVADTGIAREDLGRLPLHDNRGESDNREDNGADDDGTGYLDDRWGASLYPPYGFPALQKDYARHAHGTQVASVLAAATATDALASTVAGRMRLSIGNVVKARRRGNVPDDFWIDAGGIEESVRFAATVSAAVLNWSVEGPQEMKGVLDALQKNERLLVVAAAGNDGALLTRPRGFPAGYVLDLPKRLLTVAAHDPKGMPTTFSNKGAALVDIAAPGCGIATIAPGGATKVAQGTSFAAPLVSLTAALLASAGLEQPAEIKRRILATARLDDKLSGVVAASGRLDMPKALAIRHDTIERASGDAGEPRLVLGQVMDLPLTWPLCGRDVRTADVVRIIPHRRVGHATPMLVRLKQFDDLGRLMGHSDEYCALPDVSIKFRAVVADVPETLALAELQDFVPRLMPSARAAAPDEARPRRSQRITRATVRQSAAH